MATPLPTPAGRSWHRLGTYCLFAGLVLASLVLEKGLHEMHVSKLLLFSSLGVWARELPAGPLRRLLVGLVGALCALVLLTWYEYRHQHLVQLRPGMYRISNNPDPSK